MQFEIDTQADIPAEDLYADSDGEENSMHSTTDPLAASLIATF